MKGFFLLAVLLLSGYKIHSAFGQNYYYPGYNNGYNGYNGPVNCVNNNYATFPYPNDNNRYYYCLNNQALVVQCPVNSYYNPNTRSCSNNYNNNNGYYCPSGVNTMIPAPNGDCQNYILCLNGQGSYQTCPNGYYFQPNQGTCSTQIPSNCNNGWSGSCSQPGQLQPVRNNCQVYNYCNGSTWSTISCPNGYYFSPSRLTCGPTRPSECGSNYYTNYYDNDYNNNYNNNNYNCPSNGNSIVSNGNNCKQYTVCNNGIGTIYTCGSGLYFNSSTNSCTTTVPSGCNA